MMTKQVGLFAHVFDLTLFTLSHVLTSRFDLTPGLLLRARFWLTFCELMQQS